MKFEINRYIFIIITLLSCTLNAQVSVLLDSESKVTASGATSGILDFGIKKADAAKSSSSEFHVVKTIDESTAQPDMLTTDEGRATYRDLNKVAADPNSNFLHSESNTLFPFRMGEFERIQLIAYPNVPGRIEAIYTAQKGKSSFIISLTPTREATEGRLRDEYLKEIKKLSNEEKRNYLPKPTPVKFNGRNYICNGVQGSYADGNLRSVSQLTVFECGVWLLGIKLKAGDTDFARFSQLEESLTLRFNPARLTALSPLNLKSNVTFAGESMKDTESSSAMVNSAFKKMDWASAKVSKKERYSGFPDIYLAMHIASLTEYLRIQAKKSTLSKNPTVAQFYNDLSTINDAGFLPEFIMEEYENVMIVPDEVTLNFEAYKQWKQGRELKASLKEKKYTIAYRNLPY